MGGRWADEEEIREALDLLQSTLTDHVVAVRREYAKTLRQKSTHYRTLALQEYTSVEDQARLDGMGDAFAIAADIVDVKTKLEAVPNG